VIPTGVKRLDLDLEVAIIVNVTINFAEFFDKTWSINSFHLGFKAF